MPSWAVSHRRALLWRANSCAPPGSRGRAAVRAQLRAAGLLQLRLLTHCDLLKCFSVPVPLFATHPVMGKGLSGELGPAGHCLLLQAALQGLWMQSALPLGGCRESSSSSLSRLWRGTATDDNSPAAFQQPSSSLRSPLSPPAPSSSTEQRQQRLCRGRAGSRHRHSLLLASRESPRQ